MQAVTGHYYKLDLVLSGPLQDSSDWLPKPLTERYPVDVVSVSRPVRAPDQQTHAEAVVRWKSGAGSIMEGDIIQGGGGMMSPLPLSATAVVVAVVDLGLSVTQSYSALPNYLLAAAILFGTLLLVRRIP